VVGKLVVRSASGLMANGGGLKTMGDIGTATSNIILV
jgi:hypothetical protein